MLGLPASTEYNRTLPKDKLYRNAITTATLREIYDEQIETVIWRNKLSKETWPQLNSQRKQEELEVFEVILKLKSLDKRLLRQIDRNVPYYILFMLNWNDRSQAWIANKRIDIHKVRIENYLHTAWLTPDECDFSFSGSTVGRICDGLKDQIRQKSSRKILSSAQADECDAFMNYFRVMKMSRSYKPVLIMATLRAGGTVSIDRAADFFTAYYQGRADRGLVPEFGNCVYADKEAKRSAVINNLVTNPVKALCGSGFFVYDPGKREFSFADGIYDGLTLSEIDEISSLCRMRLKNYFKE